MSSPTSPPLNRKALWIEFATVLVVFWAPVLYSSVTDLQNQSMQLHSPVAEVFDTVRRVATAILILVIFVKGGDSLRRLGFRPYRVTDSLVGMVLFVGALLLGFLLVPLTRFLAQYPYAQTHLQLPHQFNPIVELIIYLCAAFREEVLYRAYICVRLLDLGSKPWVAVSASAAIFASSHLYQGWSSMPWDLSFGILFAVVFLRTRSIWPLIVSHALYNSFLLALRR